MKNYQLCALYFSAAGRFLPATLVLMLAFASTSMSAQTTLSSTALLAKINRGEKVELSGVTIKGNLDFSLLENKTKTGSYGVRNGSVKEYRSTVKAPIILKNCTLEGKLITRSEYAKGRVLNEYFVNFDAQVSFENCRFTDAVTFESLSFGKKLSIRNCTFSKNLRFEKVHFSSQPLVEGNQYGGELVNLETNWSDKRKELLPPPVRPENAVTLILKNSSVSSVEIEFDAQRWNLAALGKSTLATEVGQEIYLLRKGKRDRKLLTVTRELDGQTIDINKL